MPNNKFKKLVLFLLKKLIGACAEFPKEKPVESKNTLVIPKETKYER